MQESLEKIVDQNLKLTGAKRTKFIKEAQALRRNLILRQKQKDKKKCMSSK